MRATTRKMISIARSFEEALAARPSKYVDASQLSEALARKLAAAPAPAAIAAASMVTKKIPIPALGWDTSENLSASHYAFLASKGYTFGVRYVPLSGQSPTASGVIQPAELANALASKIGVMFVQFSRSSNINATTGRADGMAAGTYVLSTLKAPADVCLWADMFPTTKSATIDYLNAWYEGTIAAGMSSSSAGVYFEPGCPLTASERYSLINLHRYWATAANDPARMVASRGCELIQAWASPQGQFFPEPGLVIDGDFAQLDYLNSPTSQPVGVYGA